MPQTPPLTSPCEVRKGPAGCILAESRHFPRHMLTHASSEFPFIMYSAHARPHSTYTPCLSTHTAARRHSLQLAKPTLKIFPSILLLLLEQPLKAQPICYAAVFDRFLESGLHGSAGGRRLAVDQSHFPSDAPTKSHQRAVLFIFQPRRASSSAHLSRDEIRRSFFLASGRQVRSAGAVA